MPDASGMRRMRESRNVLGEPLQGCSDRPLTGFFRARRGAARGFRFRDPFDHGSAADGGLPTATDQWLGTGDGSRRQFALVKRYGSGDAVQERIIHFPVAGSVRVSVDGVETAAFIVTDEGAILLDAAPGAGIVVRAGFLFDVAVREEATDVLPFGTRNRQAIVMPPGWP